MKVKFKGGRYESPSFLNYISKYKIQKIILSLYTIFMK